MTLLPQPATLVGQGSLEAGSGFCRLLIKEIARQKHIRLVPQELKEPFFSIQFKGPGKFVISRIRVLTKGRNPNMGMRFELEGGMEDPDTGEITRPLPPDIMRVTLWDTFWLEEPKVDVEEFFQEALHLVRREVEILLSFATTDEESP